MDDLTNSCIKRVQDWKTPLTKPSLDIKDKQKIEPDIDNSILYQRFPPSNKIPIGRRYKMQSVFQQHLSKLSTNNLYCRTEANFKELDIFEDSTNEQEYQGKCIKTITEYKGLEKLLSSSTMI